MACEYEATCLHNDKCYRCYNQNLLKLPQSKKTKFASKSKPAKVKITAEEDNTWEDLEQQVADALNDVPTITEARRTRASGALWYEQGDILDQILHPECKERTGRVSRGSESMSIQREWLEKAKQEVLSRNQLMCLPFRFKGDSAIYVIFDFNDISELVTMMKAYLQDNKRLEAENKVLREKLQSLK